MTAVVVPGATSRFVRTAVPAASPEPDAPALPDSPAGAARALVPPDAAQPDDAVAPVQAAAPAPRRGGPSVATAAPASPPRQRRAPAFRPATEPADGTPPSAGRPGDDSLTERPVNGGVAERRVAGAVTEPPVDEPDTQTVVEGYVLFRVGGTAFAVPVGEVREIVRAVRLELLPAATAAYGHGVALVDARGRSIPVVDLRSDRESAGDVLLPLWRHQVGLVVDRVTAVQTPRELVREHDEVPAALPSYSRGVLRPVDGGSPVLLIALPDAAELDLDAARPADQRLGHDVLAAAPPT